MKSDLRLSSIRVIGLVLGFAIQLFFTKIVGVKEYGVYTLFSTWTGVFALIIILGHDKVIIKDLSYLYIQKRKGKFRSALDKLIFFVFINSIIFLILAFCLPQSLIKVLFSASLLRSTWILIAVGTVVYTVFILLGKILSATQRVELTYVRSEIIYKFVWLASVVVLFYYFRAVSGVNIIVVGTIFAYAVTVLIFFLLLDRKKILQYLTIKKEKIQLGRENYVFFLLTFNGYFISQLDKVILGKFASMETLGVYGLVTTLCNLIGFSTIVYQRFLPKISNYIITDRMDDLVVDFKTIVRNALLIALPLIGFILVFAEDVLLFFGEKYVQGAPVLRILIIGQMFNYYSGPNGNLLINGRHSKIDFYNTCVILVLSLVLNYFGYKFYGVLGVAVATSLGVMLINIAKVIEVKIFYKIFPYEVENVLITIIIVFSFFIIKTLNINIHSLLFKLITNFSLGLLTAILTGAVLYFLIGKKYNYNPLLLYFNGTKRLK